MLHHIFKKKLLFLILAVLFFLLAHFLYGPFYTERAISTSAFEKVLHKKEHQLNIEMLALAKRAEIQNYNQLLSQKPDYYNTLFEQEGLVLLIYENDTLKFWSDNAIAFENWIKKICLDTKMVQLQNGWFELMKPQTNASSAKTIMGLILIKNEYPYQNKYLKNEFQKDFPLYSETKLIVDSPNSPHLIKNFNQEYLFSLEYNFANKTNGLKKYIALLLNLLAFLFVSVFLKKVFLDFNNIKKINKTSFLLPVFILIVLFLRYISIKYSFPKVLYDFELFSPKIYADSNSIWQSSLGDLLINVVLLFYITYFVFKEYAVENIFTIFQNIYRKSLFLVLLLAFAFLTWAVTALFLGLIKNSNIIFGINNLFELNPYIYVAIVIVFLLLFFCFLFADKLVAIMRQPPHNRNQNAIIFCCAAIIHCLVLHVMGIHDLIVVFFPFALILTITLIKEKVTTYTFSGIIVLVFLFSFFTMHVFVKHSASKELESRKIYAEKLAAVKDPVAEFLFQDIEKKLKIDTILISFLTGTEKRIEEFEKRLKQTYFSGFWEKYEVRVTLFDSLCRPLIKPQNAQMDNTLYFDELITKKGSPTSSQYFVSLNNPSGKISYLVKFPVSAITNEKTELATIYIELDSKFISSEIGFPELLLDKKIILSQELSNYSHAKYIKNRLVNQFGKYQYDQNSFRFYNDPETFSVIIKDQFSHLLYRPVADTLIIISKRKLSAIERVTTFSYLFAFFSLLLFLFAIIHKAYGGSLFNVLSLKNRIQLFLIFIVLSSLALFGGATISYIKKQFEAKNNEVLSEKTHSVLKEMESKFSSETVISKDLSEYTTFILKKFSNVFFADINLFDAQGNLFASSRPKLFDEGIISKKMNAEAFLQIAINEKSEFIHAERIGELKYLSAYIPFKNKDGRLLAYLNLPYFAKQNELEKEISGFLVTLINIYVLLFVLSIGISIFISNYVTKPLKLIQDKLSKIKLGKTNDLIEWQDKDEIGSLVSEYNRMIVELTISAELLAKSERESAWREMAKQVAHEIKNPLTPMKLNIQHLQRIWKDGAPDMEQNINRISESIIEQIDTLSSIATEFSNFAKMPKANLEKIRLEKVLLSSISLFHSSDKIDINFKNNLAAEAFVWADNEQLLRVFNNLIKNAIQAIPEERPGKIDVELNTENNFYIISIKDNGLGISDEVKDKIFVPNFTTKTAGMGLGLAMVKNIIEQINGGIRFETEGNIGTVFSVTIPHCKE